MKANKFINTEADRALASAAAHTSPNKLLSVLMQYMRHRSSTVRGKAARYTVVCVKRLGGKMSKLKNAEEVVKVLLVGLDDSNRDVRTFSRDALAALQANSPQELVRCAERVQPDKGGKRIRQVLPQ